MGIQLRLTTLNNNTINNMPNNPISTSDQAQQPASILLPSEWEWTNQAGGDETTEKYRLKRGSNRRGGEKTSFPYDYAMHTHYRPL